MKRKRAAAPAAAVKEHLEEADNPYELEREYRMTRNRQVLKSLGLLDVQPPAAPSSHLQAPVSTRVRREKTEAPVQDLRRSKRAQGLAAEVHTHWDQERQDAVLSRRRVQVLRAHHRPPSNNCADEAEVAAHNKFRMSYMSEDALRRRIHKITNIPKMRNFVQLLKAEGHDELAQEAEQALAALLERL